MLTRAPLAFDLSMIAPGSRSTSDVVFIVSCPCISGGVLLRPSNTDSRIGSDGTTPTTAVSPSVCQLGLFPACIGLSPAVLTATTPRWCFPDSNSCASAPATPIPNSEMSPPCFQQRHDSSWTENSDLQSLEATQFALKNCGFYYGGLTWQKAAELLKETSVGTFLVRDSADPRHLFSLSVQTDRGPTSVRIHYADGEFRLDCEDRLAGAMPTFVCVLKLLEHYRELSRTAKGDCCIWLDGTGKRDLRVRLYRPLYSRVPSLQHACRVAVNGGLNRTVMQKKAKIEREKRVSSLQLPNAVENYLMEYPFGL